MSDLIAQIAHLEPGSLLERVLRAMLLAGGMCAAVPAVVCVLLALPPREDDPRDRPASFVALSALFALLAAGMIVPGRLGVGLFVVAVIVGFVTVRREDDPPYRVDAGPSGRRID